MKIKPNRAAVLVAVAIFLTLGFVLSQARKPETPAQRASRVVDCILEQNAVCVYQATDERDRKAYSLTQEKVDRLIKEYVGPIFDGRSKVETVPSLDAGDSSAVVRVDVTLKEGRVVTVSSHAASAGNEALSPKLVNQVLLMAAVARYPKLDREPNIAEVMAWREAATKDREILESIGINGIFRSDEEGLRSWADWTAHCDSVLEKLRNPPPAPSRKSP
jgi:hypothetical protein